MKNTKYNQSNSNLHGRNKYELRCKKNGKNKNINEEESDEISDNLSDSSLSCASKYMTRGERKYGESACNLNNISNIGNNINNSNGNNSNGNNSNGNNSNGNNSSGNNSSGNNSSGNNSSGNNSSGNNSSGNNYVVRGERVNNQTQRENKDKGKNALTVDLNDNLLINNVFSKQSFVYDHYRKKDILLSLWWKNIVDLYSDILITNLYNNVSNIEILNMNNHSKDGYQYLNEGIVVFHNSKKRDNYKMSILRVITKEEVNKKNEQDFFYSSALKNNIIDDSFKKYYGKKYKHVPIIKRYNCMNIPYYATNSTILYCNKEMCNNGTNFVHDGNVIIANKSIKGKIYLYNIKKTIDRINKIEEDGMLDKELNDDDERGENENENENENEDKDDDTKFDVRQDKCEQGKRGYNLNKNYVRNNDASNEKDVKNKRIQVSEKYRKKLQQRKIYDGQLLLELVGHTKTGKGLFFKNNYLLSNGDDKNIFIYDINSNASNNTKSSSNSNSNSSNSNNNNHSSSSDNNNGKYSDDHENVCKIHPYISIKTNELYSNVRWLYDSLIIGSTYSGYFSLFDIRMKNKNTQNKFNHVSSSSSNSSNSRNVFSTSTSSSSNNVNIHSIHKKITKYEISDIDKYNSEDNNLICLSSLNNIFIFDIRFINNNLPYKIIHDNSYNNYSLNDCYFEPYQTSLQNGEYTNSTNVNYFYDHSYNNYYNEDFFNSDTFIHSLFWCNIEAFNYIGSLNNKGIINLFDVNKSKHHCVFTYGCKYIKLFKFNPFKINNFVSVDKNNILILFTLPDQIYKSDLDLYLKDNFKEE
ncbi:WD repeat-containing protein [Plasmodium brasilianum]|uniref:WD repeat-containing protein n=1 Tax=Plasmodium brasilianum TaxID=5824 RepID=A0ACB9Y691_PLABR|nr:WD repeat-containing protein [Plasmodium brasilianum]